MSEEVEQTEETTEQPKKVKKGFTLLSATIDLLEAKAKESGHNQSKVVDAVLSFGLPVYGERGMGDLKIVTKTEWGNHLALSANVEAGAEEPVIPVPEPVPTKRGRREKLRVPEMNQVPQPPQQVVDIQQQQVEVQRAQEFQDLYRPKMGPVSDEVVVNTPMPGTHTPMAGNERLASLEATMNLLMQHMMNMQATPQQQMPQQPAYPQQPVQAPEPAPVFAASYPPGYTGPPGVAPGVPQPQQPAQQGMYPLPNDQPQQRQDLQDPYAMNIGQVPGSQPVGQGGLTAQGLLSGNQPMSPNVGGGNVNMDIASRALGPNWRNNLHRMEAAGRREQ